MSELEFWKRAYLAFGSNIITYSELRDTFPEYSLMANSDKLERWGLNSGMIQLYNYGKGQINQPPITIDQYLSSCAYRIIIKPEIMEHE